MKIASLKYKAAAALLCAACAFGALVPAAAALEVGKACSMEVGIDQTLLPSDLPEELKADYFAQVTVTTSLYRVADVDADYRYTAVGAYAGKASLDLSDYATGDSDHVKELSAAAWQLTQAESVPAAASATFAADKDGKLEKTTDGAALGTGLYLMATTAEDASGYYTWSFAPVLISLPSMNTWQDAENQTGWLGTDQYDLTGVKLKPEYVSARAPLKITKQLLSYSTLQGPATFIFKVEGVAPSGAVVYSDVLPLVFTAAGTESVTIPDLPVGTIVNVTEVYSGSAYTATTEKDQTVTIEVPADQTTVQELTFVNDYDENHRGGSSITNHFDKVAGSWKLTQING